MPELEDTRYHYSLFAMTCFNEFWNGKIPAGIFGTQRGAKRTMLKTTEKIKSRLDQLLTMDETLREKTDLCIGGLEREIKGLDQKRNNDIEIIGYLFQLIAFLLGYDYKDGEIHREVIYFQTKEQEEKDMWKYGISEQMQSTESKKRIEIVGKLHEEGFRLKQIARIMNYTVYRIKQIIDIYTYQKKE